MENKFIQAKKGEFLLNGRPLVLRGLAVGSWMNIENFMIRMPGNEQNIRKTFAEVYGKEKAEKFFDDYLASFLAEDDFIFIKSLGVNVLRFALNYRHFEDDQEPGKFKEEGFKHLDRVLELCRKYGIFAILDMHSVPGGQNSDSHSGSDTGIPKFWEEGSFRDRTIRLWGHIAKRYQDETIIAGYDLLNEPNFVSDKDAFNDFYEKVIQEIRRFDQNHIVFLEGDNWSKDFSLFKHLGGDQQALSFHLYPGQHGRLEDDSEERKAKLEKILMEFVELREKTGMPLWIGETGGHFPKDRIAEGFVLVREGLDLFEKYGISWTFWSYKDAKAMSLVYPKEGTPWMRMGNDFRPKWQSKEMRSDTVVQEVFQLLEKKFSYPIDQKTKRRMGYRITALLDELHAAYLVKPKLESISWEEMKDYPKSFLWENCDYFQVMADILKSYFARN